MDDRTNIVKEAEAYMRKHVPRSRLSKDGSDEDYLRHVLGARRYALQLADVYHADKFVLEVAALLHDTGAYVGEDHAHESAKIAERFLARFKLTEKTKRNILDCIERHSMG